MSKTKEILITIVAIILVVGMIASTVISTNVMMKVSSVDSKVQDNSEDIKDLKDDVKKSLGDYGDVAQEDDVLIMDEYTIKSTTQISDAYISGDDSKLSDEDKETLQMASDILKDIIKDGMTDYEKEKAVYEWLVNYTTDSTDNISMGGSDNDAEAVSTPHGVLKGRSAVCVGYATTFRLMMQMLGIDCKVVHSSDCVHSWDEVKLDDEWYFVDVYTDSSSSMYKDFNLNDDTLSNGYSWNRDFFPAAIGVKYCYAYQNKIEVDSVYDIINQIKKGLEDKNSESIYIEIKGLTDEDKNIASVIYEKLNEYVSNMYVDGVSYMDASWLKVEDEEILAVYYPRENGSEDESSLSDDVVEKINKALSNAFDDYNWDDSGFIETYYNGFD